MPCPASDSSQASRRSSTWVFALGMTCQQHVIRPSQASIRQSRQRSGTGRLVACLFLAGCMWESRCWQLPCGTMPHFSNRLNSSYSKSAGSSVSMWLQHSTTARAMLPWPLLRATLKTLLPCPPQPPRLPCSLGCSPAPCSLPKGGWDLWRCLLKSRLSRPRWCLACWSLSAWHGRCSSCTTCPMRHVPVRWHTAPPSSSAQSASAACSCQPGSQGMS
ncbi:TPA: hypothetical protein ACH3X1_016791 [Trebouxia sp. C0004]